MLTDADILQRLKNTEDATVERKVRSDFKDVRKSVVAFANSLPVDDAAVIFVGVKDNGDIESENDTEDRMKWTATQLESERGPVLKPPGIGLLAMD